MAKYILVASYYDSYKKQYENEIRVEIEGVDLSSLQKIDIFTSSNTKEQILDMLGIKGLNHLAIKYYKNQNANPEYDRVIINNPDYNETIIKIEDTSYYLPNERVYIKEIKNKYSSLYQEEKSILKELINNKDITKIEELYPKNDNLKFLINRYITTDYTDVSQKISDYNLIFKEFSNHKTFRNWIIFRQKHKEKKINNNPVNVKNNINKQEFNKTPKKLTPKRMEKLEDEYITMLAKKVQVEFQKEAKKKKSELEKFVSNDNLKNITEISEDEARRILIKQMLENTNTKSDEYEEFLEEDEINQMTNEGVYDSYEENYYYDRQNTNIINSEKNTNNSQQNIKPKKLTPKRMEKLEDEYITMLAKKVQIELQKEAKKKKSELEKFDSNDNLKNITEISETEARRILIKQMLENINTQSDEYEEFLEEDEINQMTNEGVYDSYEENFHNTRYIKR